MNETGTLIWIGDRDASEFRDAYEFCESNVAQLAYRKDVAHAIERPASSVQCILIAQGTRAAIDSTELLELSARHHGVSWMNLQGSLCEGARVLPNLLFGTDQHYWHRWNQVLPDWLAPCASRSITHQQPARSVAILASHHAAADALLDLARSAGVTTVWCSGGESRHVCNVDAVWWDDSVARPTTSRIWRQRVRAFESLGCTPQHAWIANSPRLHQAQAATEGGVDLVVSKPHRIDVLLESLAVNHHAEDKQLSLARAA